MAIRGINNSWVPKIPTIHIVVLTPCKSNPSGGLAKIKLKDKKTSIWSANVIITKTRNFFFAKALLHS